MPRSTKRGPRTHAAPGTGVGPAGILSSSPEDKEIAEKVKQITEAVEADPR